MAKLLARDIINAQTQAHYAYHKTIKQITGIHSHDFYELFLVTLGSLYHCINGTKQLISEGKLVFIRPNDEHYYESNEEQDCELLNLAFTSKTIEALFGYLGEGFDQRRLLDAEFPPDCVLSKAEIAVVRSRFEDLTLLPTSNGEEIKAEVRTLLAELMMKYFNRRTRPIPLAIPNWLQRLEEEMNLKENFTAGLSHLYVLAPHSPEHVSRTIKKYFGKTPTEWINRIRLNYAANLLVFTDETVLNICMEAGFENLSHFYHEFKKAFHTTPSVYRKANRKIAIPK